MSTSSEEKKPINYAALRERYPVGSIIELGKYRSAIVGLYKASDALSKKLVSLESEINQLVKEKVAKMDPPPKPGEKVSIDLKLDYDKIPNCPYKLNNFIDTFASPDSGIDAMMTVAFLLLQEDMQLPSEEFRLLEIIFSDRHGGLPLITGYRPEVFTDGD